MSGIGRGFRLGGRRALSEISRDSSQTMVEGRSEPGRETRDTIDHLCLGVAPLPHLHSVSWHRFPPQPTEAARSGRCSP